MSTVGRKGSMTRTMWPLARAAEHRYGAMHERRTEAMALREGRCRDWIYRSDRSWLGGNDGAQDFGKSGSRPGQHRQNGLILVRVSHPSSLFSFVAR